MEQLEKACRQDEELRLLVENLKVNTPEVLPVESQQTTQVQTQKTITPQAKLHRPLDPVEVERAELKAFQKDAEQWRLQKEKRIDPFTNWLETWKPASRTLPVLKEAVADIKQNGRVFVITAFDWHLGAFANPETNLNGKKWNVATCQNLIDTYIQRIAETAKNDHAGFEKAVILWGGDLYHSLTGETAKGTQLQCEVYSDQQFDIIMNMMIKFVEKIHSIFGKVECHFVRGNHGGVTDYPLGRAVAEHFRQTEGVDFNVYSTQHAVCFAGNNMIVLSHGASSTTKSKLGKSRNELEARFARIDGQIRDPRKTEKINKYMIVGDKHHFKYEEFANFELIQCRALPLADTFAGEYDLYSKAGQNCFVFDNRGLSSQLHFIFE